MADFKQAVKWMREDKKVRLSSWHDKDLYIEKRGNEIVRSTGERFVVTFIAMEIDNWEIYEEREETLSDYIFKMPRRIKCGEQQIQSEHTESPRTKFVYDVSNEKVELLIAGKVKEAVKKLLEFTEGDGIHDGSTNHKIKEIFGEKLV